MGRLIDEDDVIDALRKCNRHCIDLFDSYHIDIEDAEARIRRLPSAQPEPKWIPVKWREPDEEEAKYYTYMADCEMPEDEQEILVTDGKYVWKEICFYDDGFHLDSGEDWQNITAWMPLPKPYREEGD